MTATLLDCFPLQMDKQSQYQGVSGRCSLPAISADKCEYHLLLQHDSCRMIDGGLCPNERWSNSSEYCWKHRAQDEESVPTCSHIFTKGPLNGERCKGYTTSPDSAYCQLHHK